MGIPVIPMLMVEDPKLTLLFMGNINGRRC